ncbi:hypothetical protein CJ030_MR5G017205 [Morella rubra]|uniref:Uncharacterized protein n=1 Tax=Morella rubra TaxID=262757 RepID=A0A6A1VM41_9ROSI|nr:hypothetical protein CJ030_MR5G017205 [Morella rubra]
MAPRQDHLVKVGLEGFGLIDEYFGRPRRSKQSTYALKGNPVQKPEPGILISSEKAAAIYGGMVVQNTKSGKGKLG